VSKLVAHSHKAEFSPPLTNRQIDILRLLQEGLDNQSIARRMGLSVKTVENHLTRLYRQLNVQSRLEAVRYATQHPEVLAISGHEAGYTSSINETRNQEGLTILLVDDNARYRHQLRRMVGKVHPRAIIYEAEATNEALRLAEQIRPQLVLIDVVLGEEDGIGLTRRLKALAPSSRIVLITAYPDREFHRRGLEAGAVALLDKKDLDALALRQVINDVSSL
jgi:DNA-binding NarL/FixJ family response regulator